MTLIAADSAPGEPWCQSCCCRGTAIICAVLRAGLESHSAELWAHPVSQRHGGRDTSAPGDRRHRARLEHWLWGEQSRPQSQPLFRPHSSLAPAPSRLQGPGGIRKPSCCPNPALAQPLPPPALQAGCTFIQLSLLSLLSLAPCAWQHLTCCISHPSFMPRKNCHFCCFSQHC